MPPHIHDEMGLWVERHNRVLPQKFISRIDFYVTHAGRYRRDVLIRILTAPTELMHIRRMVTMNGVAHDGTYWSYLQFAAPENVVHGGFGASTYQYLDELMQDGADGWVSAESSMLGERVFMRLSEMQVFTMYDVPCILITATNRLHFVDPEDEENDLSAFVAPSVTFRTPKKLTTTETQPPSCLSEIKIYNDIMSERLKIR